MMRADYDSEADALDIRLFHFERYEHQEEVDDDYCRIGFAEGRPADVELLSPAKHLDLLILAAERFDLDATALVAAARAALAAPDRIVELSVGAPLAA